MHPLCRSHGWTVVNHYYTQKLGSHHVFFAAMLHSQFVPHIVATVPQNWLGPGHAAFVQKSWLNCGKSLLHTKLGSNHVFFAAMLHSQFVPHIVATMLQNWLGLGHAAFVQKSWLDCGKSLLHTKPGSNHVIFAAMLHSLFVPHIVATVPQSWLGLGHAAFVRKSWLDCGKSLLHTKLGSQHVFFVAMLHSLFVPHIVATVPQNWLGPGHAAFVQKSWLDCGKSLLHTKLGSHHVLFAAMLHSLFVPHIVVTMLQNWLGLGHASFVQKSWLDCGKSLLHTKLGSHHVFFAAMLHSQFVPHIVATVPQNWLGPGHAAFEQKSWLNCGKSLLHTKLGSNHVFFAAMLHSQFVPHIVATMLQNWLGLGHAAFVQKSWLDCGKSLLHTKPGSNHVFFAAMLHSLFVPHIVATVPQSWLGLGHAAFVRMSWLDCGKSLLHTKLGSQHVFFVAMLHSQFVPHIVVTMLQNWLGLGHASFVQKSWLDCGKSLLHTKLGSHHVFFAAMLHSQFVPHIVATVPQNWLGPGHAAFVQKSWLNCGKSLLHTKLGSNHVFFAAMLHSQFVPHIVATMLQNWLGLGHAAFVQKSWLDCGKSLLHTKPGSNHVFFAAMLHSLFVPHIVATVPQSWLGLGHAAFVRKSWLDCGKSLLHTKLGSQHVFFVAMLHSLFVPHIVATVPQNWLGPGHAAFVQKSWLDCGKSLLHTKLGSHHVLFAAMLHSLFVPHIVVTMLQNWLGLGHASFVQKSWLDCGKSLLHTKLGSHHVFFAAMLHSQFVPHIVATVPQNWLGPGHAAFEQKSWLNCGKSLLHTKLGSNHVFFAAMLHSQFVPHIVATMLQNWLGLGHAAFVQKSWLDCGKSLLHTKPGSNHVFFAAMLHSLFVPHIVATVPQSWLGLGHAAFVRKSWLDCGKSLLHTKLGSQHVFFVAMLHSLFVPHIVATVPQNWLGSGHAAFVQKSWLDCGKSLLHTKLGSNHVFFAAMLHSQFVPHIVATMLQNWLGLGHAAFVRKSWLDCGKSLLHTKLGSHHVLFAAMLHSLFVPHIVVTMLQNWLGLGHAAFVQKSWLDCGKSLLHTKLGSHHVFFAAMLHSQFVPHIVATVLQKWLGPGHAAFVQKSWLDCGKSLLHTKLGSNHVFFAAMLHSQFVPHIVATMLQNWLGLGHAAFVQKS